MSEKDFYFLLFISQFGNREPVVGTWNVCNGEWVWDERLWRL